jgi:four helix bundle protein
LSFELAVRIVNLYKFLVKKNIHVVGKQVLRSGTSIGANVHEGIHAQSNADFINKMNIALKEASETDYWLRLLYRTEALSEEQFTSLCTDNKRIMGTLVKIINTANKTTQQGKAKVV